MEGGAVLLDMLIEFSNTYGLVFVLLLIILSAFKEISRHFSAPGLKFLHRMLDISIAPMIFMFGLTLVMRIYDVVRSS